MEDKYRDDGVDRGAGDIFSRYCYEINKRTYGFSPYVTVYDLSRGNFRGPRGYAFKGLPGGCIETSGMDGIGTKTVIIAAAGNFFSSARDVIAMTAMDITRWGGLPLMFMNTYDVRTLGEAGSDIFRSHQEVMRGLESVARSEKYVLFTGETAELGLCVGSENPNAEVMFNWCGAMTGVYHQDKMILGDTLYPGQAIIALRDDFRSNGISTVRKALAMRYGKMWWNVPEAREDILACASPSVQYDRMLNSAHGWFDQDPMIPRFKIHLIVHLSGGAFESKLGDLLKPLGLSAELTDLFTPSAIMQKCAQWRGMDSWECYRTWNGGQGAIVVVDWSRAENFVRYAQSWGIDAKIAGKISKKRKYSVKILSKFRDGATIYY